MQSAIRRAQTAGRRLTYPIPRPLRGTRALITGQRARLRPRKIANDIHRFKASFIYTTLVGAPAGGDLHVSFKFKLADLPNVADYAIFDQYRIKKIILRFEPSMTGNDVNGVSGTPNTMNPMLNRYVRVIHDYDSDNVLTSENDYFSYPNMKSYPQQGKPWRVVLYPKVRKVMYDDDAAANVPCGVTKPPWIDMTRTNVPHRGIKAMFSQINYPESYEIATVLCTLYFDCKNAI